MEVTPQTRTKEDKKSGRDSIWLETNPRDSVVKNKLELLTYR